MSRLYYSPYRHFRVVIVLHRIRNRMNELFIGFKKVRAKAKAFHYSFEYHNRQSSTRRATIITYDEKKFFLAGLAESFAQSFSGISPD